MLIFYLLMKSKRAVAPPVRATFDVFKVPRDTQRCTHRGLSSLFRGLAHPFFWRTIPAEIDDHTHTNTHT